MDAQQWDEGQSGLGQPTGPRGITHTQNKRTASLLKNTHLAKDIPIALLREDSQEITYSEYEERQPQNQI